MKTLTYTLCAGAVAASLALNAHAQITVDGTLDANYGSALAVQTINTGFGVSTSGDGTSAGGSEMDAAYGTIYGGSLYVFLAGNYEANGNHVNLFISTGGVGQSTLSTSGGTMAAMNGSQFSPGFQATYAIDMNDSSGTTYIEAYNILGGTATGGYVGNVPLAGGIGNGTVSGIQYGWNDTHVSTMGASGTAANQAAMLSTTTGAEISIPLSVLGNPTGPIEVLADINGGGDNYLANQFLPGLPVSTGNVGTSSFNFSSTPGEFFTVPAAVPEPCTLTLVGLGLAGFISSRRRK